MDKTKIFEAAGKFASKGQHDKAAKEYQRVLEADPKDVRALQKMAELHQKNNRPKEATDLLLRVADIYGEQGFFLKAVAVYKQILKFGQERIDVNLKLAALYQQLGLVGDATQQYQLVANWHDKQGNVRDSLAALRKMVDLDPDNVASRVKLGELYAREKMTGEAVAELKRAASYLKKNGRTDDYLRVIERVGQLVPDDAVVAKELAQACLAAGDTKRALAKLQVCFRQNPRDVETLTLLARAFQELGQDTKTASVYRELAHVYGESGQKDLQKRTLEKLLELVPGDSEATEALRQLGGFADEEDDAPPPARSFAPPAPAPAYSAPAKVAPAYAPPAPAPSAPAAPAAARGGLGTSVPPPNEAPGIAKLLTETDVYLKYGLVAKAVDHVRKALAEAPQSLAVNEKLVAILDKQGKNDEAVQVVATLVELARAAGDRERDRIYTQELGQRAPGHPLVAAAAADAELEEADDLVVEPEASDLEAAALAIEAADEEEFVEAVDIEVTAPPTGPVTVSRPAPAPAMAADDPFEASFADDDDDTVVVDTETVEDDEPPQAPPLDNFSTMEFERAVATVHGPLDIDLPSLPSTPPAPSPKRETTRPPVQAAADLDPFEAFDAGPLEDEPIVVSDDEGLDDETIVHDEEPTVVDAAPIADEELPFPTSEPEELPGLDETFGEAAAATFDTPFAPLETALPAFEAAADEAVADEFGFDPPEEDTSFAVPAEPAQGLDLFGEEVAEAEFLIQQGMLDDARYALESILAQSPEHPRAGELLRSLAPAETTLPPGAAPTAPRSDGFDLADELAGEFDELEREPTPKPAPTSGDDYSVEGLLGEFKKRLDETLSSEDSQTHYDLGIAYKEMGLLDEAIREFEVALGGRGARRVIDCLTMVGVCRIEKGQLREAMASFEQALQTPGLTIEASKEAHYQIGFCLEKLGDKREALSHYARVFKADQTFRDVRARVATLQQQARAAAPARPDGVATPTVGRASVAPPARPRPAAASEQPAPGKPADGRGKIGYV